MFTRQHYKAIAKIIAGQHTELSACDGDFYNGGMYDTANNIAKQLADYFAIDNPLFNRDKFMVACGLK